MTVKELHEMNTSLIEHYIDRKTNTRFTLNYSEHHNVHEFITEMETYKANLEKKVVSVWAMVDKNGNAVLVAEYQ